MAVSSVTQLAETLRRHRLLEPEQQLQVDNELQRRFPEPRALAKELLKRNWLTPYQANQLFQNRGNDLLLGSYVLLERLGEGGMGQVFKARNWKLGQVVAIKLIRKDRLANAKAVQRFVREIRLASRLEHPNVVRAFDADEINGVHFFVMEYVEGIHLSGLVKKHGPLGIPTACEYIRQAALGLQHAFEQGMVHRDIKPDNLLLTVSQRRQSSAKGPDSSSKLPAPAALAAHVAGTGADSCLLTPDVNVVPVVKIMDMGLARVSQVEEAGQFSAVTVEGMVMGTPDYMAPEQVENPHGADIRADLYSLGCTLYFLLTGRAPFAGGSFLQKLERHRTRYPVAVEQVRPGVPLAVAGIVRQLMAKKPEDRFQSPAELAEVLSGLLAYPESLADAGQVAPAPSSDEAGFPELIAAGSGTSTTAEQAALATPQPDSAAQPLIILGHQHRSRGSNLPLILTLAAVAVVIVLLVVLALRSGLFAGKSPRSDGGEHEPTGKNTTLAAKPAPTDPLQFSPGPVTDDWINAAATQTADKQVEAVRAKLVQLNPKFNGKITPKFGPNGQTVAELTLSADELTDLSPLRALPSLKKLKCAGTKPGESRLADLSSLRGLMLAELDIAGTGVTDLTPLAPMPLKKLNIKSTRVADLKPLQKSPLEELEIDPPLDGVAGVLKAMPKLKKINGKAKADVLAADAGDKKTTVATDPAKAGPDWAIQGEYLGEAGTNKLGAEVIARGDGKFEVNFLPGGLRGEGGDFAKRIAGTAKIDGPKTAVTSTDGKWTATIADGAMKGKTAGGDEFTLKKTIRESKTVGKKPPEGAIVLYGGPADVKNWTNGKVVDGNLLGNDSNSTQKFKDQTVHVEFRLSFMPFDKDQQRSNSGVYLQHRYEVQVLDSFGLKGESNECGGIYSQTKPKVNMCYPPLTWQTYDIEFKAARFDKDGKKTANPVITVYHNGVLIHDKVEVKGPTVGGQKETPDAGPLHLQGHGGQVQYRNVWVLPVEE